MSKIVIHGVNVEVTAALSEHSQEQLKKITSKYENLIKNDMKVTLEVDKHHIYKQKAKINVPLKGKVLHIETETEDMYTSINELSDKLDNQLSKIKSKTQSHRVKRAALVTNSDEEE